MNPRDDLPEAGADGASDASADTTAVSALLHRLRLGDADALSALFPLVYEELSALAHRQRQRWHGDLTLNTTALVHEAYLKLARRGRPPAESRAHFFAVAAKAMRHVLCNYARARGTRKRGGEARHVSLGHADGGASHIDLSDEQTATLAALDESLERLERLAERQARVVECRFFGGMSVEETARALGISERTVKRDWSFARAWLRRELGAEEYGPVQRL